MPICVRTLCVPVRVWSMKAIFSLLQPEVDVQVSKMPLFRLGSFYTFYSDNEFRVLQRRIEAGTITHTHTRARFCLFLSSYQTRTNLNDEKTTEKV